MKKLDEIALNIELVLISIIEGVALTKLAENAIAVLRDLSTLQFLPYVLAGLAILLVFWSQAILHAVSFIRWPLKMEHMFLYFVAGFLQVVAYSSIQNMTAWFFWWTLFSLLALVIYIVDLRIIVEMKPRITQLSGGDVLMHEVETRHKLELSLLIPTALAFNCIALALSYFLPTFFANPITYASLGALQFLISIGALFDCIRNFSRRAALLNPIFGQL